MAKKKVTSSKQSKPQKRRPGKVRTWWHPLLVRLLRHVFGAAYVIDEEVSVGDQPLRVDIFLLRRQDEPIADIARRVFPELIDILADYSYIEFKGPTDSIESGDFEKAMGVVHLHRSEHARNISRDRVAVIFVVPTFNQAFRNDLKNYQATFTELHPGCYRIDDAPFQTWCIETSVADGPSHPGLTLVGPRLLTVKRPIIKALTEAGFEGILNYVIQLIRQFQSNHSDFDLHHTETHEMVKLSQEFKESFIESLTPSERVNGLSADERVDGLSLSERLGGINFTEFTHDELAALLPQDLLRQLRLPHSRDPEN